MSELHRQTVEPLYTIDQLAALTQQSRRTIERRIRDGQIPVIHYGQRCVRIRESVVQSYASGLAEPRREGGSVHRFPTIQGGTA